MLASSKAAQFLQDTARIVERIEGNFLELGERLYRIKEEKMWAGAHDNYTDYLEEARINPSLASMLVAIHKEYIVAGGKSTTTLKSIGYSNLYEAIPLIKSGGVDRAIVKASKLTRSEIKDEVRADRHGEHEHVAGTERWGMCACGKFVRIDE